jgi:hypothetical protein
MVEVLETYVGQPDDQINSVKLEVVEHVGRQTLLIRLCEQINERGGVDVEKSTTILNALLTDATSKLMTFETEEKRYLIDILKALKKIKGFDFSVNLPGEKSETFLHGLIKGMNIQEQPFVEECFQAVKGEEAGSVDAFFTLLEKQDSEGNTPLHLAMSNAKASSFTSLNRLVESPEARVQLLMQKNNAGNTPIHQLVTGWPEKLWTLFTSTSEAILDPVFSALNEERVSRVLNLPNREGKRPLDVLITEKHKKYPEDRHGLHVSEGDQLVYAWHIQDVLSKSNHFQLVTYLMEKGATLRSAVSATAYADFVEAHPHLIIDPVIDFIAPASQLRPAPMASAAGGADASQQAPEFKTMSLDDLREQVQRFVHINQIYDPVRLLMVGKGPGPSYVMPSLRYVKREFEAAAGGGDSFNGGFERQPVPVRDADKKASRTKMDNAIQRIAGFQLNPPAESAELGGGAAAQGISIIDDRASEAAFLAYQVQAVVLLLHDPEDINRIYRTDWPAWQALHAAAHDGERADFSQPTECGDFLGKLDAYVTAHDARTKKKIIGGLGLFGLSSSYGDTKRYTALSSLVARRAEQKTSDSPEDSESIGMRM